MGMGMGIGFSIFSSLGPPFLSLPGGDERGFVYGYVGGFLYTECDEEGLLGGESGFGGAGETGETGETYACL